MLQNVKKGSPTSKDFLVYLAFCSNVQPAILPLGNNTVGVRFLMTRALMQILENEEVEGRKQLQKTR